MVDLLGRWPLSLMLTPMNWVRAVAWWGMGRWVQRSFPGVPTVTTQGLASWLDEGKAPAPISPRSSLSTPILIDVRRDYEFAVSHLPQAHHAPNLDAVLGLGLAPHQPIVAYCSVGYRSARLAAQLRSAGYSEVYNLAGSAFQWANEGRVLVSQGQPVKAVHPFNSVWGLLLKPGLAQPAEQSSSPML
ncbi:MAG: rhodanese-like domain-containing protein [Leptolyngbya sp. DLM2.Bin27]|nr:MAG: rhodanese-like domain-containing protein [Leptolyngbya sp. DLM2.Bin27]